MNPPTVIASLALAAIVAWAIYYIVSHKRHGGACLGCPVEGTCPASHAYSDSASSAKEVTIQPYGTHAAASPKKRKNASECHCGCSHVE